MITHNLKLEDINKGFDLMHAGESIRSVVVLMKNISEAFSFEGKQLVCSHLSLVNNCEMTFAVLSLPK